MSTASRTGLNRPPRRQLVGTHRKLQQALSEVQEGRDVSHVLAALTSPYAEDSEGLTQLLTELGARTPADLLEVMRMLTVSAGYTALTWAGGLTTEGGGHFTGPDVLSACWSNVEWAEGDAPQE